MANLAQTSALVDGRSAVLNVPHTLPCGSHGVQFLNQTLGEKINGAVQLSPGSKRRVLADFNSAKPHVVVLD